MIQNIKEKLSETNKSYAVRYSPDKTESTSTSAILTYVVTLNSKSLWMTSKRKWVLTGYAINREHPRCFRVDRIEGIFEID